ncbi:hypothetical protein ACIBI4_12135 [Streptomyces sp. NPDC050418]|uniref:hypothetical protein n=1 Tax=Streptomyces sp. NPDC050418 TaxID=3365612 RepID=UPI0037A2C1ED
MESGMPLASIGSKIFDGVFGFLPDWIKITVLALVLLAVVVSWVVKIKRKVDARRALRQGRPTPTVAQGQPSGADYLGPYAPQQSSGADHLGTYAPQQQSSGADHLGSYAPQQDQSRRQG